MIVKRMLTNPSFLFTIKNGAKLQENGCRREGAAAMKKEIAKKWQKTKN